MKKLFLSFIIIGIIPLFSFSSRLNADLLPTKLRITVIDNLGNKVEGATVTLYANEFDYRNNENQVSATQTTDKKGRVTFVDLRPTSYFIDARKGNKSNDGQGVQTQPLQKSRMNKLNVVIM
ncbi:MAG: carboxypeptidase-like regulatory domain-containing protein [Candidatus Cyclobacteriaceae bacterium M3_2C_046]